MSPSNLQLIVIAAVALVLNGVIAHVAPSIARLFSRSHHGHRKLRRI